MEVLAFMCAGVCMCVCMYVCTYLCECVTVIVYMMDQVRVAQVSVPLRGTGNVVTNRIHITVLPANDKPYVRMAQPLQVRCMSHSPMQAGPRRLLSVPSLATRCFFTRLFYGVV
jgi:hypothetical protein